MLRLGWAAGVLLCVAPAVGDDAPVIDHQPTCSCEFPPVIPAAEAATTLVVYATHPKQGRRLSRAFDDTGVSYVAAATR